MEENRELSARQRRCLVMIGLICGIEAALTSVPPFDRRKSASVR
jgi:hypothetical protein